MMRSTKIVATLGPSSSEPAVLERMVRAGVDVVRLNFSHGVAADHERRAALVKEIATKTGRTVAILCDLQGPKIRVGKFKEGRVTLEKGQHFVLDAAADIGNDERVGLDYKELPRDVKPGDTLLLNDGLLKLTVDAVRGEEVHTTVVVGGELSNNKGINKQGGGLTAPALTAKDMEDIRTAMSFQADYVAVSFPKNATDMMPISEIWRRMSVRLPACRKIRDPSEAVGLIATARIRMPKSASRLSAFRSAGAIRREAPRARRDWWQRP